MRLSLPLSFLLLLLFACGPSKREELLTRLAAVKEALYQIENSSSGSRETEELLEYCSSRITQVENTIEQGETERAELILSEVELKLDRYEPPEGTKEGPIHIIGAVTYVPRGTKNYDRMTAAVDLDSVDRIRTGIRSGISIEIAPQSRLWLPAQSEVRIVNRSGGGRVVDLELINGTLRLDKSETGRMSLAILDLTVKTDERTDLEISSQPLTNTAYLSLFTGNIRWDAGDGEDKLESRNGLLLVNDNWYRYPLPSTPIPGEPEEGEVVLTRGDAPASIRFSWSTVAASPEYQIQISENQYFASRVHDRLVSSTFQQVDLPPGDYFWRIRGYKEQYLPGGFSRIRSLKVKKGSARTTSTDKAASREKGPPLEDLDIEVISDMVIVNGRTTSDARITINDTSAIVVENRFRAVVNFNSSGKHRVTIKAIDPDTGAETIEEREVNISIR